MRVLALATVAALLAAGCTPGRSDSSPRVVAFFEDVGDLVPLAGVQVSDVEVGQVTDIELVNTDGRLMARVEMSIGSTHNVPASGLRAVVRQTSLLGEQFIELTADRPGVPFLRPGTTSIPIARTERRVDVETFLGDLAAFLGEGGLEDLNRFTHAQALILEERGDVFGETIEELDRFTGILANRRLDIAAAIDHLADASQTLAANQTTIHRFLGSLEDANRLLSSQGNKLGRLFRSLRRFGNYQTEFLVKHEKSIDRQFRSLEPILDGLAGAKGAIHADLRQLRVFFELFPKSMGTGPGAAGAGDYVQVDAVLCDVLDACHSRGEKGDVPGEGS